MVKAIAMVAMALKNSMLRHQLVLALIDKRLHGKATVVAVCMLNSSVWAQYAVNQGAQSDIPPRGVVVRPSITISETFSDNVSLARSGAERGEWTTQVKPSLSVVGNGPRLKFNATYTPEFLFRRDSGDTGVNHFLNSSGTAELVQRFLYVDASANVFQQNVSLSAPQSDSNLNTTGNRTTVRTFVLSPYLRHDFGYDAVGELRFTHDVVSYGANSNGASSSSSDQINARLTSGRAFQLLNWGLSYSKANINYTQTGQKVDSQNIAVNAGRLIVPNLRLNASVGYEDSGYPTTFGQAVKGNFWSVGPTWTPTPRTNVSATFGRRYYGPSNTFNVDHRSRLSVWRVGYSESVATTRSSLAGVGGPLLGSAFINSFARDQTSDPASQARLQQFFGRPITQDDLGGLLRLLNDPTNPIGSESLQALFQGIGATLPQPSNFLADNLFLEKRWQATFGIEGTRNTVLGSLYSSNREALTTVGATSGDFNLSQSVKQTGAGVSWSLRATHTLIARTSLDVVRNEFTALGGADRLYTLRVGLTEQFSPKLTGALLLSRVQNNSNRSGAASYTENSLSATLGLKF